MPDAIKSQYQNPPPTLIPAGVRQLELVCSGVPDRPASKHLTTEAEQEEVTNKIFEYLNLRESMYAGCFWMVELSSNFWIVSWEVFLL